MTPADRAAAAAAAAGPSGTQSRRAAGVSVSRPAGGATRARSAPRSLLSLVPGPRSLPWRADEALSLRRGLPRPLLPGWQGRHGSPLREAKSGDPGRQARALVAPSLQPARGALGPSAVAGLAVFATLVPCSPSPPFLPLPLRRGGFRSSFRGEPLSRLVGSCEVCSRSGEFFFAGGGNESHPVLHRGAGGGVTVVRLTEPSGFRSP